MHGKLFAISKIGDEKDIAKTKSLKDIDTANFSSTIDYCCQYEEEYWAEEIQRLAKYARHSFGVAVNTEIATLTIDGNAKPFLQYKLEVISDMLKSDYTFWYGAKMYESILVYYCDEVMSLAQFIYYALEVINGGTAKEKRFVITNIFDYHY